MPIFSRLRHIRARLKISSRSYITITAIFFSLFLNTAFWKYLIQHPPAAGLPGLLYIAGLFAALSAAFLIIFNLIIWPHTAKPLLIVLILLAAALSYYMHAFNVFFDVDMLRNVLQTTAAESLDVINPKAVIWFMVLGLLPSALIYACGLEFSPPLKELRQRGKSVLLAILAIAALVPLTYRTYAPWWRNHREARKLISPVNTLYSAFRYGEAMRKADKNLELLDPEAEHVPYEDDYITVFVVVIGETARAMNYSLNGYHRKTNPYMEKLDIINFKDTTSGGTSTAISVPIIFSSAGRKDFSAANEPYRENLVDLLKNTGYDVFWEENDSGCKNVCKRVETHTTNPRKDPKHCDGDYCHDEVLLEGLEERLRNVKKDTFIVLHLIGSHGPAYYRRYPAEFEVFKPVCGTQDIQNCSKEALINTYDNTIVYTDYVLSKAIGILKKYPRYESGLLYVSDHGESLGEKGLYLHSLPFAIAPAEQTRVPMHIWMSETMKREDHINYACMKKEALKGKFSHDNIFHSLLGLMELQSTTYDKSLDFFEPCRTLPLPENHT